VHRTLAIAVAALALVVAAVAPAVAAAAPIGRWAFDEGSGTTAADSGRTHPATLLGGAGWTTGIRGPSALQTNGASAYADTGASVVDATRSFTVSAWAKFDRLGGYQTVVSIDGSNVSGFYLQLRGDTGRFAFVRLSSDSRQAAAAFPSATFDPSPGTWYLLAGVYDAAAGTYSPYVDGSLEDTVKAPPAWRATGHLVIGRGKFAGNPVDWVAGAIDDVRVYQAALTPDQVARLALAGLWRLDEGSGTTAADSSPNGNDLTLSGGASWTRGVVGPHGLAFDGTSGAAEAPGPVVDTSQGFSVAAWVRPDSTSGFATAVSVDGAQVSGFFLQRRDEGRFAFTRLGSDAPGPGAFAASDETARAGQWVPPGRRLRQRRQDADAVRQRRAPADGDCARSVARHRALRHRTRQVRRGADRLVRRRGRRRARLPVPTRCAGRPGAGDLGPVALRRGRRHARQRQLARRRDRHAAPRRLDNRTVGQRGVVRRLGLGRHGRPSGARHR
jgi:Concanavalin A-like lectin/glucanases superfamily